MKQQKKSELRQSLLLEEESANRIVQTGAGHSFGAENDDIFGSGPAVGGGHHRQSEWYNTTFLLLAEVVGAGVLGLPYQMVTLGWVPGFLFLLFCFFCNYYTGIFLWRIQKYYPQIGTLAHASEIFFGPRLSMITQVSLSFSLFFIMASYLLVLTLNIQSMFYENHICQTIASMFALGFLIFPSQLRTLHGVSYIGIFSTFSIVVVLIMCIIKIFDVSGSHEQSLFAGGLTFLQAFSALSTIVFGSGGQLIYLEMIGEMKKPEEFPKAFVIALVVMFIIYSFIMGVSYLYYGNDTVKVLLDVYDNGIAKQVASVFLALHVTVSYTLIQQVLSRQGHLLYARTYLRHSSLVNHISLSHQYFWKSSFQWFVLTVIFGLLVFLLANLIPFFDNLIALIGSLILSPISYILPCVYYLQCAKMQGLRIPTHEQVILWLLIAFGVALFGIGTYSNVKNIFDSWSDAKPFSC